MAVQPPVKLNVPPLPEPVEVRDVSGEIAVQPQVQVQLYARTQSQSKGALYAARLRYSHSVKFSCTPAPRSSRSARCVQCDGGTAPESSSVWHPLPELVEGAYVQRDCGTVTGAS